MCNKYGHDIDTNTHYNWNYHADNIVDEIINERPALWFTLNDTYGSHAMAVCYFRY